MRRAFFDSRAEWPSLAAESEVCPVAAAVFKTVETSKGVWWVRFPPSPPPYPLGFDNEGNPINSRGSESEMGHNRETQAHSDDVPNTIRRNGTYYYNRRIPSDLVEVAAFGLKKGGKPQDFIKHSLRTKDPREARRRVSTEDAKAEQDFEEKRQSLAAEGRKGFDRTKNSEKESKRRLASLSGPERRDLILALFVTMERQARASKHRELAERAPDRNEAIKTSSADLAVFEGSTRAHRPEDWDRELGAFLKERGIEIDSTESESFVEMRDLLKRAYIENEWRTLRALQGDTQEERDSFFRGWGAESKPAKASRCERVTIDQLCEKFLESKRNADKAPKTLNRYERSAKLLAEVFGNDREVSTLTPEDGEELISLLKSMPVMTRKAYRGKPIREAIALARKNETESHLTPKRIKDLYDDAKSLLHFALGRRWIEFNPFAGRHLLDQLPKVKRSKREQFSPKELTKIFHSECFQQERKRRGQDGERIEGKFWVFLLCLFHGLRQDEACALRLEDLELSSEIPFMCIRELEEGTKRVIRLKNDQTARSLPIHPKLVEFGFADFVNEQKKRGKGIMLFPEFRSSKATGKFNTAMQKWFPRLVERVLGIENRGHGNKTNHTLRGSFVDALRAAEIPQDIRIALQGRSDGGGRSSEDDYGKGYPMDVLLKHLKRIEYPGVDFTPLYPSESDR